MNINILRHRFLNLTGGMEAVIQIRRTVPERVVQSRPLPFDCLSRPLSTD